MERQWQRTVRALAVLIALTAACSTDAASQTYSVDAGVVARDAAPRDDAPRAAAPVADTPRDPRTAGASAKWTFAVLSDLHLPNPKDAYVDDIVAALVDMHVRLVVVTGDHTNGNQADHKRTFAGEGWTAVMRKLRPLHDAGIPVLPVAGNHDTYLPWQRDEYAEAFQDLPYWTGSLAISSSRVGGAHARAPFSYSVDVDGVHFALAHIVAQAVEPDVARWLADDLEHAAKATHRIVFEHVPISSVIRPPHSRFRSQLGAILEAGRATMMVAGHEHVVWDENVSLPRGDLLRQVLVGCASGVYIYGPNEGERERARCSAIPQHRGHELCHMPNGGGVFELAKRRNKAYVATQRTAFTLFDVDGDSIDVRPMTLDSDGRAVPFYLDRR